MEILTSTNFISNSYCFPPIKSRKRMENYKINLSRYKGDYNLGKKLKVLTANGVKYVDWTLPTINYFKLVTDKSLGLMLNEKPNIIVSNEEANKKLNDLLVNTSFWLHFQNAVRSFSSLGDGVIYLYKGESVGLNAVNPELWYKVVDSGDINKVICHILVQPIFEENYYETIIEDRYTALKVLYHYKGYFIEKYFSYDGVRIGESIEFNDIPKDGKRHDTGLKGFAVFDFNNSKAIDEVYGVSDYQIFSDVLALKEKKLSQLDAVLDKHFDPILQVPLDTMRENEETGKVEFNGLGNIIGVRDAKNGIKYISWDAKTDAILSLVESLDKEIAVLSEMGEAFLTGEYANVSGEALKVMIKSALDKVSRHIDTIESSIKEILTNMLYLEGVEISPSDINIEWQDGISESDSVKSQTIATRVSSGTLSRRRALMKFDGLTSEQADAELSQIKEEGGFSE